MSAPLISKGSTVLVTGVNSFIGSHVADQLLQDGYNVRGTVRSLQKGAGLKTYFDSRYGEGRFEIAAVKDITEDGAFDEAVKGIAGVCHVATAAKFTTEPHEAISSTVKGALAVFEAAIREPNVNSVVYTSDSYAALLPQPNKKMNIAASTYNEDAVNAAHDPNILSNVVANAWDPSVAAELVVWAAAKVAAEKAVWEFVADNRPSFQVSTILPNMNFGPSVGNQPLTSTGTSIPSLLSTTKKPSNLYFSAQYFVDVRDCAKLHIAALLDSTQRGQRIFACAEPFHWNDVLAILRWLRPEAKIREDFRDLGRDLTTLPNKAAEELLRKWYGHGWTGLEESVKENIEGL